MSTNVCIRHSTRPCTYRTVSTHYRFSFGIRRRMYNGIGLPTPRGSGTSGYIQRNLSHLKPRRTDIGSSLGGVGLDGADWGRTAQTPKVRKPNAELLEHERRRQVEIKLLYFADELRESNVSEDAIAERVAEERERLLALLNENTAEVSDKAPSKHGVNLETHQSAKLKEEELKQMRLALNLRSSEDDANTSSVEDGECGTTDKLNAEKAKRSMNGLESRFEKTHSQLLSHASQLAENDEQKDVHPGSTSPKRSERDHDSCGKERRNGDSSLKCRSSLSPSLPGGRRRRSSERVPSPPKRGSYRHSTERASSSDRRRASERHAKFSGQRQFRNQRDSLEHLRPSPRRLRSPVHHRSASKDCYAQNRNHFKKYRSPLEPPHRGGSRTGRSDRRRPSPGRLPSVESPQSFRRRRRSPKRYQSPERRYSSERVKVEKQRPSSYDRRSLVRRSSLDRDHSADRYKPSKRHASLRRRRTPEENTLEKRRAAAYTTRRASHSRRSLDRRPSLEPGSTSYRNRSLSRSPSAEARGVSKEKKKRGKRHSSFEKRRLSSSSSWSPVHRSSPRRHRSHHDACNSSKRRHSPAARLPLEEAFKKKSSVSYDRRSPARRLSSKRHRSSESPGQHMKKRSSLMSPTS